MMHSSLRNVMMLHSMLHSMLLICLQLLLSSSIITNVPQDVNSFAFVVPTKATTIIKPCPQLKLKFIDDLNQKLILRNRNNLNTTTTKVLNTNKSKNININTNIIQYKGISYEQDPESLRYGDLTSHKTLDVEIILPSAENNQARQKLFDKLHYNYCSSWSDTKSQVEYNEDSNVVYTLTDFLPPLLQAMNGVTFTSHYYRMSLPSFLSNNNKDNVEYMTFNDDEEDDDNNNNDNQVGSVDVRYKKQWISLTCNCWGFAWDVFVQADNDCNINNTTKSLAPAAAFTISCGDQESVGNAFINPQKFQLLQNSKIEPRLVDPYEVHRRNKMLQSGDVLLIWEDTDNDNDNSNSNNERTSSSSSSSSNSDGNKDNESYYENNCHRQLVHVAIYLDDDLYYEKSGGGDNLPFRLSTLDMIQTNFPPLSATVSTTTVSSSLSSSLVWEWRRLIRTTTTPTNNNNNNNSTCSERLKSAKDIFSVDSCYNNSNNNNNNNNNDDDEDKDKGIIFQKTVIATAFSGMNELTRRKISIDLDYDDNNNNDDDDYVVKSQLYTGIVNLDGMEYDNCSGRASLPKSAFTKSWYDNSYGDEL